MVKAKQVKTMESLLRQLCGITEGYFPSPHQKNQLSFEELLVCKACRKKVDSFEPIKTSPIITAGCKAQKKALFAAIGINDIKEEFLTTPFVCGDTHTQKCGECCLDEELTQCAEECVYFEKQKRIIFKDKSKNCVLPQSIFVEIPVCVTHNGKKVRRRGNLTLDRTDILLLSEKEVGEDGFISEGRNTHRYKTIAMIMETDDGIDISCKIGKDSVTLFDQEERIVPKKDFYQKFGSSIKCVHLERENIPMKLDKVSDNAISLFTMLQKEHLKYIKCKTRTI